MAALLRGTTLADRKIQFPWESRRKRRCGGAPTARITPQMQPVNRLFYSHSTSAEGLFTESCLIRQDLTILRRRTISHHPRNPLSRTAARIPLHELPTFDLLAAPSVPLSSAFSLLFPQPTAFSRLPIGTNGLSAMRDGQVATIPLPPSARFHPFNSIDSRAYGITVEKFPSSAVILHRFAFPATCRRAARVRSGTVSPHPKDLQPACVLVGRN